MKLLDLSNNSKENGKKCFNKLKGLKIQVI